MDRTNQNKSALLVKLEKFDVVVSGKCESGVRRLRLKKDFEIFADGSVKFWDKWGMLNVLSYEKFCVEDIEAEDRMDVLACMALEAPRDENKDKIYNLGECGVGNLKLILKIWCFNVKWKDGKRYQQNCYHGYDCSTIFVSLSC